MRVYAHQVHSDVAFFSTGLMAFPCFLCSFLFGFLRLLTLATGHPCAQAAVSCLGSSVFVAKVGGEGSYNVPHMCFLFPFSVLRV